MRGTSLSVRMLVFISFMVLGFAGFSLVASNTVKSLADQLQSGAKFSEEKFSEVYFLLERCAMMQTKIQSVISERDPDVLEKKLDDIKKDKSDIMAAITSCGAACSNLKSVFERLSIEDDKAIELLLAGNGADAYAALASQVAPIFGELQKELRNHSQVTNDSIKSQNEASAKEANAQVLLMMTIAISGSLIIAVVGWLFRRNLVGSLERVSTVLVDAGNNVNTASSELSAASQQVSQGAIQAATSLQDTVASIQQLSTMVNQNSMSASEAANLAKKSSEIASEGEVEVRSLIASIDELAQSSSQIDDIINVIDDIAFQTNLLALNAAVEAARAGEQGRGFAVVAEAVRSLAQRSATAAKEISALIRDNAAKIERGTSLADRSGRVLAEILSSVRKVTDISNEIAIAGKEQSNELAQITKTMNALDDTTQRNAATSEQVAASSDAMLTQSELLHTLVIDLNNLLYGVKQRAESDANHDDSKQAA